MNIQLVLYDFLHGVGNCCCLRPIIVWCCFLPDATILMRPMQREHVDNWSYLHDQSVIVH